MLLQYIVIALITLVSAIVGYLMGIAKPWLDKRFNQVPATGMQRLARKALKEFADGETTAGGFAPDKIEKEIK